MNPALRVASLYAPSSPRQFGEDIQAHMLTGYVYASPHAFLLTRPVPSNAAPEAIRNPWYEFPQADCDTWFIYAGATADRTSPAGLVKTFLTKMPFPLPLAAWERQTKGRTTIKFFSITRLVEVLCRSSARGLT
jgi:hypothetical protein